MKQIIFILGTIILVSACDASIDIIQPTILVLTENPTANDTVYISVKEYAEIDGEVIPPDYYEWEILDKNENSIYSDFESESEIYWIPDSTGYYFIRVKIGYDQSKSITTLKEITIVEGTENLQKKLVGKWEGHAETIYGLEWDLRLSFDSSGHYTGKVTSVSDSSYFYIGPFERGVYITDNWVPNQDMYDYRQYPHPPSEDIPCTKFILLKIIQNEGFGILSTGYEYETNGNPYQYECHESFEIRNLVFSGGGNGLDFFLADRYDDEYDWSLRYHLNRVI